MRDPKVISLQYRLETGPTTSFKNTEAISYETPEFQMRLSDGIAIFELKNHFSTEEEARKPVDEFLRVWELDADLTWGRGEIRFVFEKSHIVDRNPPPPGTSHTIYPASIALKIKVGENFSLHVTSNKYPLPPQGIKLSPDMETLWFRYQLYLDGREQLNSMGYFCLTIIENRFQTRKNAARNYNIEKTVLNKLGELTSTVGDYKTARKASSGLRAHTNKEIRWIEETVKRLVKRVAEYNFDPQLASNLSLITMTDLPSLT